MTDVARVAQPDVGLQPLGTKRVIFQHFNTNDRVLARSAPHNCDATIPDSDEWPPDLIFDVAYGCAALAKWGTRSFIDFARGKTHEIYYDDGGNKDDGNPDNPRQATNERATRRAARSAGQETALTFTILSWGSGCAVRRKTNIQPMQRRWTGRKKSKHGLVL